MSDDERHFRLTTETGRYSISGGEAKLRVGTTSALANTAIIAREAFRNPLETNVVLAPDEVPNSGGAPPPKPSPATKTGSPGFNLALIAVVVITFICLLAVVIYPLAVGDKPTSMQSSTHGLLMDGFKIGLGALVGLISGKALS